MIELSSVRSLSDFQSNTDEHLRRLKATGEPEVLTVNGKAEVVVQSAEAYQKLLDAVELSETLPTLRKSLDEANRGEGVPAAEVFGEIRNKLGIKDSV